MGLKKQLGPPLELYDSEYAGEQISIPLGGASREYILVTGDPAIARVLAERIRNLLALEDACLDKLEPGEPFFVLRGTDMLSPVLVKEWAGRALQVGASEAKVAEALETAGAMLRHPVRKMPT